VSLFNPKKITEMLIAAFIVVPWRTSIFQCQYKLLLVFLYEVSEYNSSRIFSKVHNCCTMKQNVCENCHILTQGKPTVYWKNIHFYFQYSQHLHTTKFFLQSKNYFSDYFFF
jgi:hypothetical protein